MHGHSNIKFCMLFYGRTTWPVIMRETHRLRGFHNSVLRKIFGPKMEEVTGDRRKVHKVEFNDVYTSSNIIRVVRSRTIRGGRSMWRVQGEERCLHGFAGEASGKRTAWRTQS